MSRLSYLLPLAAFVVLAAVFATYLGMMRTGERVVNVVPSALIAKPVPAFALPPIAGGRGKGFSTADLTGKVSVVNVFASWCIPCRAEHAVVTRLAEMKVAAVYGLNYKNKAADALKWLAELGDPYDEIGADVDGRVGIDWGVYGVPETFVIDRQGIIRHKHVGPMSAQVLERDILPIIEKLNQ